MKKLLVFGLCLTLALCAFATSARASGVVSSQSKASFERNGGHRPPPPPRGGRPGGGGHRPPPPRRGGYHHGSGGWVGFGVGAAIGTAIGSVIANSAPAPEPAMVYDPSCNCYYYR